MAAYPAAEHGFRYTAADLIDFYSAKEIGTLVVCNPDNPSGNALCKADMEQLPAWTAQRGIRLLAEHNILMCDCSAKQGKGDGSYLRFAG